MQNIKSLVQSNNKEFYILFLTEMWERYGFYVIQTLLIFYLSHHLKLQDTTSYIIVGSFTALAYINCFFGGLIADKLIGSVRSVFIGGVLLSTGYSLLSLTNGYSMLHLALAIITVGTGFMKPNITALVGEINSKEDDTTKGNKYTVYYMGIYIGALCGSLAGSMIQVHFGWQHAFLSAAIGSIISTLTFWYGIYKYSFTGWNAHPRISCGKYLSTFILILIITFVSYCTLYSDMLSFIYFILLGIFAMGYILYNIISHHGYARQQLITFFILIVLSVCYWGIYFQQFFSLSLCIDRVAMKTSIPTSALSAIESFGIILFGPVINQIWTYYSNRNNPVSNIKRVSLGFLFNAISFTLIAGGLFYASNTHQYLPIFVIMCAYMIIAIGELSIAPTQLSMVTKLVPHNMTATMTGISLISIGFGGKLAGILANDSAVLSQTLQITQNNYAFSFLKYAIFSMMIFVSMFVIKIYLNRKKYD